MAVNKFALISTDCFSMATPINFKKLYLYFDKLVADIYMGDFAYQIFPNDQNVKSNGKEIISLAQKGVMQLLTSKDDLDLYQPLKNRLDLPQKLREEAGEKLIAMSLGKMVNHARKLSLDLQSKGMDITPIYSSTSFLDPKYADETVLQRKAEVLRFVFSELPEPTDDISWEQLIEFKNDPTTASKFYRLVTWINEVAKEDLSISEIRDRFYSLYYDYEHQFKIHKMKYNMGAAEVLVNVTSDILSGKFSSIGSTLSLLNVKKQQLLLMEAELSIPGKELAYVIEAKSQFGGQA